MGGIKKLSKQDPMSIVMCVCIRINEFENVLLLSISWYTNLYITRGVPDHYITGGVPDISFTTGVPDLFEVCYTCM